MIASWQILAPFLVTWQSIVVDFVWETRARVALVQVELLLLKTASCWDGEAFWPRRISG